MQVASVVRAPGWRLAVGALASTVVVMAMGSGDTRARHVAREIQTGVTGHGFVVAATIDDGYWISEVAHDGATEREMAFPRTGDVRFVGASTGVYAIYQEDRRIRLRRLADGKDAGMFGSSVRTVCHGVASNDTRFGVGWLESDDKFWFVHGPVAGQRRDSFESVALETPITAQTRGKDWCGIASAESKIALLWRERDRLLINLCTAKKCASLPGSAKLEHETLILGFGCLRNACLLATRDRGGKTALSFVTESGSIKWTQPLVVTGTSVSIVGVGDKAFAVAVDHQVLRVDRAGKRTTVWEGPVGIPRPQLSWSAGQLLVARDDGGDVVMQTIELR